MTMSGNETARKGRAMDEGRRIFLKSAALLGGAAAFSALLSAAQSPPVPTNGSAGGSSSNGSINGSKVFYNDYNVYQLAHPENIIYSACFMCHNNCGIKVKIQYDKNGNGYPVKIDGNPYIPTNMLPWLPYDMSPKQAAIIDGKLCPKGQAGIQDYADPYRVVKVLKRAGPRGSNKWISIPFEQAIEEIVNGGYLFKDVPGEENRYIEGLKDVIKLRDPQLAASMAADVQKIMMGQMTVDEFKAKYKDHLDVLIDPDHPDLGPKNNQFIFFASRIEGSRYDLAIRFTKYSLGSVNVLDHLSFCEIAHHVSVKLVTAQYVGWDKTGIGPGQPVHGWLPGPATAKPDYANAEFVIAWGTSPFEASYGPVTVTEQITDGLVSGRLKLAVIDPRYSTTAAKAWKWIPVKPGGDLPLAMAMIRWIIENKRYDATFLSAANKAAAQQNGYLHWTNATWLVKIEPDGRASRFVRAADLGLQVPSGANPYDYFVAMVNGQPVAFNPYDDKNPVVGDLFVDTTINGIRVKSAFQLLWEEASSKSFDEWCQLAGVNPSDVEDVAREFTSHGHKAAVDVYRGPIAHYNGTYAGMAIQLLNVLIGNPDFKGGLTVGAAGWPTASGRAFNVMGVPNGLTPFGVSIMRAGYLYEMTTLYKEQGYPAKRSWFPFGWVSPAGVGGFQDILPSAKAKYPYPIKIAILYANNVANLSPANQEQINALLDLDTIPLIIAIDTDIGDTSIYADYIFPDVTYLEQWMVESPSPQGMSSVSKFAVVRQPAAPPMTETVTVYGEQMPISMEAVLLAIAEKMNLPGFGPDGFGPGVPFTRPEHFHLKEVANVAAGSAPGDEVPDADDEEMELFLKARRHLPPSVFDPQKWQAAVGPWWRKVVYVLNRGGRAAPPSNLYEGEYIKVNRFPGLFNIFSEALAMTKDSVTGQYYSGIPKYYPPTYSDGTPIDQTGYKFYLHTFKPVFIAKRTIVEYWSQLSILPYPHVLMNPEDAKSLGLKNGDFVRLESPSFNSGELDLGPLGKMYIEGPVLITPAIRPGAVSVVLDYMHWGWGATDAVIDGVTIKADPRRRRGLNVNPLMLPDKYNVGAPLVDPISYQASYFDTMVNIVKIEKPKAVANGQYPTSLANLWSW
jgi:anaerobic selenocysteine-containing dehydrogenase